MIINILRIGIPLLILGFNVAMFIVIKFNDMHHIGETLQKLDKKFDKIDSKLDDNSERISKIEGKLEK